MRKNHGDEELKARDLFYALWVPDLFIKRVKEAGTWTLMCPHECPGLADVYGDEFETLYSKFRHKKNRADHSRPCYLHARYKRQGGISSYRDTKH